MKILVDAMNLVYRCYHIYDKRIQLSYKDKVTGLEYGFLKSLYGLRAYSPNIILVWEPIIHGTNSSFANYKNRVRNVPETFYSRVQAFQEILSNFFPSIVEIDAKHLNVNIECDTVIHNITRQHQKESFIILSNDKDFFQSLETNRVRILQKTYKEYIDIYDAKDFCLTYRPLTPPDWPFYKSLVGDPSDNIKGSPRLLKALAISLVVQAQRDLEKLKELLLNLDKKQKMGQFAKEFVLSGQLDRNFQLIKFGELPNIPIPDVKLNPDALDDYMRELGIRSLLGKFK